jgi:N-acetylmuramic acid 6-phosphate (MurNAc-6-P) etherase
VGPDFSSPTGARNPRTVDIDRLPALEVLRRINDEDTSVPAAVRAVHSGRTPYDGGVLERALEAGAFTALLTSNPGAPLAPAVQLVVCLDTGPEAVAGSTRMKAATAQTASIAPRCPARSEPSRDRRLASATSSRWRRGSR